MWWTEPPLKLCKIPKDFKQDCKLHNSSGRGRESSEEKDIKESREAGKTQVKISILKDKEGEVKTDTANFSDVLWMKNKEEIK